MLTLRRGAVGVVAVLLVGTGCSSPSQTETPAVVASTPPSPKTGTFVINPQFDEARPFSDGLAIVSIGDNWGFIDKTGSFLNDSAFDDASSFSEGLAAVDVGGKWGFIAR